jgi:hypothetical protein
MKAMETKKTSKNIFLNQVVLLESNLALPNSLISKLYLDTMDIVVAMKVEKQERLVKLEKVAIDHHMVTMVMVILQIAQFVEQCLRKPQLRPELLS